MRAIFFIFILFNNVIVAQTKTNPLISLSDVYCILCANNNLKAKEQKKLATNLVELATRGTADNTVWNLVKDFSSTNNTAKRTSNCIDKRIFTELKTLEELKIENPIVLNLKQKESIETFFALKYQLSSRYAYIDEKTTLFHKQYNEHLTFIAENSKHELIYEIKKVLVGLEDPHLGVKIKGEDNSTPTLKDGKVYIFPFRFVQNKSKEITIAAIPELSKSLVAWNNASIERINDVKIEKIIDSIEVKFGPLGGGQYGTLVDYFRVYMFVEGTTSFELKNTLTEKDTLITVERVPVSMENYYLFSSTKKAIPNVFSYKKVHFIKYYETKNDGFADFLKNTNQKDTVIIDFRGYPKQDVMKATQLLIYGEPKKVSYSTEINFDNFCFEKISTDDYFPKQDIDARKKIDEKKLKIIGIIDNQTASYVETAVMTLKTYLGNNLKLVGQPTAGAHGTIDFIGLDKNITLQYPYHKFDFYLSQQLNEKKQIVPDDFKTNMEINAWLQTVFNRN